VTCITEIASLLGVKRRSVSVFAGLRPLQETCIDALLSIEGRGGLMAILVGVAIYLVAAICLCALVGASRSKQERCLREMRKMAARDCEQQVVSSDELARIGLPGTRSA
jgi:hypothetical protein